MLPPDLERAIGKARAARQKLGRSGGVVARLSAFKIAEVSLVDRAANRQVFAIVKREDGPLVLVDDDGLHQAIAKARLTRESLRAAVSKREAVHRTAPLVALTKTAPDGSELRYVLCAVLVPEEVDAQGDIYSAEEIRKAAWGYVRDSRTIGLNHKGVVEPTRAAMVESYVTPIDFEVNGSTFKAGTWVMGIQVNDNALWAQVKRGELTGLSIGGWARKTPVEEASR